jgi:hypothetical protein
VNEMAKRIWTEEEIKVLIQENDKVLYGALKKLYKRQKRSFAIPIILL